VHVNQITICTVSHEIAKAAYSDLKPQFCRFMNFLFRVPCNRRNYSMVLDGNVNLSLSRQALGAVTSCPSKHFYRLKFKKITNFKN
jgi:hypothetical protein